MRSFFYAFLGYFLTPSGLVLLAALDASLIVFLPLGIDVAVIVLAARKPDLFWLYAVLATVGSIIGSLVTYWIGRQIGDHGLTLFINPWRLERVRQRVTRHAGVGIAALAIVPPPFPFTAFVLASGALGGHAWSLFTTLAVVRVLRFLVEGGLAAMFGRRILVWMQSTVFEVIVGVMIVLAAFGTIVSVVALYRSARRTAGETHVPGHSAGC
jgi:membrane protein YqaA with SNARE-associated domain